MRLTVLLAMSLFAPVVTMLLFKSTVWFAVTSFASVMPPVLLMVRKSNVVAPVIVLFVVPVNSTARLFGVNVPVRV